MLSKALLGNLLLDFLSDIQKLKIKKQNFGNLMWKLLSINIVYFIDGIRSQGFVMLFLLYMLTDLKLSMFNDV